MKSIEQHFPVTVLFIMLYKVVLILSLWNGVTIQMKAAVQSFPVVLLTVPYKVVLTFVSADEILKCDHSNESCCTVLPCGAVYYAVQGGSNF